LCGPKLQTEATTSHAATRCWHHCSLLDTTATTTPWQRYGAQAVRHTYPNWFMPSRHHPVWYDMQPWQATLHLHKPCTAHHHPSIHMQSCQLAAATLQAAASVLIQPWHAGACADAAGCPPGQGQRGGGLPCQACPIGYFSPGGSSPCKPCAPGTTTLTTGQSRCGECFLVQFVCLTHYRCLCGPAAWH